MGKWGVGFPATLYLDEFGSQIWSAFGKPAYLVGSVLKTTKFRDVDIRLILSDKDYKKMGLGKPGSEHQNLKWVALCLAFSALGEKITGLPIDFQIQQQTYANTTFKGSRSCIGLVALRTKFK